MSDDYVKDFVVINFCKYFKCTREKLYSKLSEEQNLREVDEWPYIFLTTPNKVKKYVEMMQLGSCDNCICHYNTKVLKLFEPF